MNSDISKRFSEFCLTMYNETTSYRTVTTKRWSYVRKNVEPTDVLRYVSYTRFL